jgi:LacI family transcriptional regulator
MRQHADREAREHRPTPSGARRPAVTIREVAETAGVSTATVSRVFGDPQQSRVSPATRQRVLRVAQQLGYRPHRAARSLARQRSDYIGVLLPHFGGGFIAEVMDGLVEAARDSGLETVFATCGPPGQGGLRSALDHLLETRAEGIIFYPSTSLALDDKTLEAELRQVPTVLVDLSIDGLDDFPLVTSDDADGISQAVSHLVSLGHDRIAHLAGPSWMSTGAVRLRAFREAMSEHGLPVPEESLVPHNYSYRGALTAARRLLETTPLPTAIVASSDESAAALLEVARNLGLRVPDDLSITGFSDTLLCQTWQPPLTTVRQPKEELGREAVRIVAAMIEGDPAVEPDGVHLLPTRLIERASCTRRMSGTAV